MELIRLVEKRKDGSGFRYVEYGLFKCIFCKQEVERRKHNGLKAKSCGCSIAMKKFRPTIKHHLSQNQYIPNNVFGGNND